MMKRMLSVVLAIVLALTISVPAFAAYSDLQKHWAKTYMEDLAQRGYLTGYTDGTMKPDNNMTGAETLAMLSRFYPLTDAKAKMIYADYKKVVTDAVPSSLSWAYDELEVCLAAGIVTETELKGMNLAADIRKVQFSVFLVRAMQLQSAAEALQDATLTFADASKISAENKGYVAELKLLGIVSGDEKNNFSPELSVTRGVVSKMVSKGLDYIEAQNKKLTIADYENVTRQEGVITNASSSSIEIRGFDALTRAYNIPNTAAIKVNDTVKSINASYIGCYATVTLRAGTVIKVNVEKDSAIQWVQGDVYSINPTGSSVTLKNTSDGKTTTYTVTSSAVIMKDDVAIQFSNLALAYFMTLKIENGKVTEAYTKSSDMDLVGTVSALTFGTTVSLRVTDDNGVIYSFLMDIASMPKIQRGGTTITVDRINVGDAITVTLKSGVVQSLALISTASTITGEITSIVSTTGGTSWVIKKDDGSNVTYTIDSAVAVYSGTTAILLSSVKAGDRVTAVIYGTTITEVTLVSAVSSTTKLSVSVLSVDTGKNIITALTSSNTLVYIDAKAVNQILKVSTGSTIYLSGVKANMHLVAYGAYTDSTTFKATSIIIED